MLNCSRYNIYVTMFYKILETFVTFLVWYSFFLIAFALGFYIMLHKDVKSADTKEEVDDEEEYKFFNNPWWSIIKTSTMFVGEIEFSDIPISTETSTWPLGYLYLLTFIFLIVVVLMNLLNGLAVSDTAVIQEKAEIVTYVIRVETIASFEAVLLGDPFNFLANWPAVKVDFQHCHCLDLIYQELFISASKRSSLNGLLQSTSPVCPFPQVSPPE